MERISATLAGCQESLLPEAEQFWIENSPLSSVSSSSFEEPPAPQGFFAGGVPALHGDGKWSNFVRRCESTRIEIPGRRA